MIVMSIFTENLDFSTMSDKKLLVLINKENNHNAFNTLAKRYFKLICKKALVYKGAKTEFDDFIQEGYIAFINAVKHYDINSNASFCTYLGVCVEKRFYTVYKNEKRLKDIPSQMIVSLDDEIMETLHSNEQTPLNTIIERENFDRLLLEIKSCLSVFEQKVLSFYLYGLSYEQIAKSLNSNTKSIDNALQRIRKKLKQY